MIFEQLISEAKFKSPKTNMIYQIEEFKKKISVFQKNIYKEFWKLGLGNYAKQYSELAYKHLTDAMFSLDLKNTYDLDQLLICTKSLIIPFLKRDLLFQLNENKFQISKYINNLLTLEKDHNNIPQNLQQVVLSCYTFYKKAILEDKRDNVVKELSKKIKKNKKIINVYEALHHKYSTPYSLAKEEHYKNNEAMTDIGCDLDSLKDKLNKSDLEPQINEKISELQAKYDKIAKREKALQVIIQYNGDKLDEIIAESNEIVENQKKLVEMQSKVVEQKALNKKNYRMLKPFYNKIRFSEITPINQ